MSQMDEPIVCSLRTLCAIAAVALMIGATIGLVVGAVFA